MIDERAQIGLIGGSGLYELGLLEGVCSVTLHTPYGAHSDGLCLGTIEGVSVAFLPRHGLGHRIPPHEVPYRANLWAMHALGVRRAVTVSAMGGTRTEYRVGDTCVPDQIIDWTRTRRNTFFDGPHVVHTPFEEPFCPVLREALRNGALDIGLQCHDGATVAVFDGPRFSTRAESRLFRDVLKADLLSMTAMPEAILARELGICYATIAVVSDLDAFGSEPVSHAEVSAVMARTLPAVADAVARAVPNIDAATRCPACRPPEGSPFRED